jgi:uncharacterized protein (DUF2236 family)
VIETEKSDGANRTILGRLDPAASTGFHRGSAIRVVSAEPVLGLILQHALVMEVAHAKVGAGVTHHSLFQSRPLTRAWSTADAGVRLVWGSPEVSRAAARQIYRFHDHVHGRLPESGPAWPQGTAYTAHDASLLLWVWATLIEVTQVAHARWLRPLEGALADAYYADMCTFARFLGIPAEMIPPDRNAFARYVNSVIDGDELMPTPTSSAMVRRVLWYSNWNVPALLVRPQRVLSVGTLDPRIRDRFGLTLSPNDQRLFDRLDGSLARWYRNRPGWLAQRLPLMYLAFRGPTIGRSGGRPPSE